MRGAHLRFVGLMSFLVMTAGQNVSALELKGLAGLNLLMNSYTDPAISNTSAKMMPVMGASILFPALPLFSIEMGVSYIKKKAGFTYTLLTDLTSQSPLLAGQNAVTVANNELSYAILTFPVMMRFNALPFITPGAGFFYSRGLGRVSVVGSGSTTFPIISGLAPQPLDLNLSQTFEEANRKRNDFGLVLSLEYTILRLPFVTAVADVDFLQGLIENSTDPKNESKNRDLSFKIGAILSL